MKLFNPEIKVVTLIFLLSEDKRECTTNQIVSFFKEEKEDTVLFTIQNLKRKGVIDLNKNVIKLTSDVIANKDKYFSLPILFGRAENATFNAKTIDSNILRAIVNLMINDSVPIREANLHHLNKSGKLDRIITSLAYKENNNYFFIIRKFLLDSLCISTQHNKYIPDLVNLSLAFSLSPYRILLTVSNYRFGRRSSCLVSDVIKILISNPTSEAGILKIIELMIIKYSNELQEEIKAEDVLQFLLDMNAVGRVGSDFYINSSIYNEPVKAKIVCDSNLCVSYSGELDIDDKLYLFGDIEKCDEVNTYYINKDSFSRAIELNINFNDIISYINNPTLDPILTSWNESLNRLKMYEGITIQCTEPIYKLVNKMPLLKNQILKDLGNGIIILKPSKFEIWNKALSEALDLKSPLVPFSEKITESDYTFRLRTADSADYPPVANNNDNTLLCEHSDKLVESREEMCSFFDYGETESASGMDYTGKNALIKQAVKEKTSLLFIELSDEDKFTCHPLEIIKTEDSGSLVRICILPDSEERIISISSIYKVTKFLK